MHIRRVMNHVIGLIFVILFSLNSYAATSGNISLMQMNDGGYFDPIYFQQTYPEIVANIGTDPYLDYQYYLKFGQCYGMKPFSDDTSRMVQSITYQPGFIVVPASVKEHPEAKYTLVYSDSNVDIYYTGIGTRTGSINNMNTSFCFYIENKTSQELNMHGDGLSVNSQMRNDLFSAQIFAASASEERYKCDYPKDQFDNISYATFRLKYRIGTNITEWNTVSFNMLFTH